MKNLQSQLQIMSIYEAIFLDTAFFQV